MGSGGQGVTPLLIASDGFFDDVDLALLRLDGSEVAASDGITPMEQITAPMSGDFLIEVLAVSGASNYVLSVGQMSASSAPPAVLAFTASSSAAASLARLSSVICSSSELRRGTSTPRSLVRRSICDRCSSVIPTIWV